MYTECFLFSFKRKLLKIPKYRPLVDNMSIERKIHQKNKYIFDANVEEKKNTMTFEVVLNVYILGFFRYSFI